MVPWMVCRLAYLQIWYALLWWGAGSWSKSASKSKSRIRGRIRRSSSMWKVGSVSAERYCKILFRFTFWNLWKFSSCPTLSVFHVAAWIAYWAYISHRFLLTIWQSKENTLVRFNI
jgi:hypothetical protein